MIVSVAFFWVPSTAPELGLESVSETRDRAFGPPRRLFPRTPRRDVPDDLGDPEYLHRRFGEVEPFTLGIEEELLVVDSETLAPTPAAAVAAPSPYVLSISDRTIAGGRVFSSVFAEVELMTDRADAPPPRPAG